MSSGGIDNSGELALAYSVSSATTYPSLYYTGRLPGDPAGVMSIPETSIFDGQYSQTDTGRWGDYSSLSLDPLDLCTFWFTGEYATATSWATRIGEFNFSTCNPQSPTRPVLTGDPGWATPIVREGQTITGTAGTFSGGTSFAYQWRRCDRSGFACIDIPGETGLTHVFTAADAAGDRTVRFQETMTNPTGASVAVSAPTPLVQSLPPVNVTRPSLSGIAQAGQILSTTNGTWISSSPISYTYRWRRCSPACAFISGATGSTYTVSSTDVGSTLEAVVSATNTGGGTDANSDPTAGVAGAPAPTGGSGGGSGSGGGGGGGSAVDLALSGYQTPASPIPGQDVSYVLRADDLAPSPLAMNVVISVSLPSGVSFVSAHTDRGSGCSATSATGLSCNLDFLSSTAPHGSVVITAHVVASGPHVLTAALTAAQTDSNLANNALTLTYVAGSTGSTPPVGLNGDGTPTKKQDKHAPTSRALASAGKRGRAAQLRFKVYDDNGVAKVTTTVKRNGSVVGKASTGYGPVAYGSVYYLGWKVPARAVKGNYSFCVVAVDRAGNKSAQTCAPLALK